MEATIYDVSPQFALLCVACTFDLKRLENWATMIDYAIALVGVDIQRPEKILIKSDRLIYHQHQCHRIDDGDNIHIFNFQP